ncbi:MAG: diguanylate cyclase [Coriobacteriia bacterium]|nr:diguanylate cyclase [Coriobacteriia bacterium]
MIDSPSHDDVADARQSAVAGIAGLSGRTVRRVVWFGFAAVVSVYVALVLMPVPDRIAYVAGQWLWALVCVLALTGAMVACRYTRNVERRFWAFLSVAATFILASQTYFAYYVGFVDRAGPPVPSLSSLFDVLAAGAFVALLATLTRFRHASVAAQVRYILDSVAVALTGFVVLYSWVIAPWFDRLGGAGVWEKALNAAYPIVGCAILVGSVRSLLGTRVDRWESWERLVAFGLSCFAIGLVLYPISYVAGAFNVWAPWGFAVVEVPWLAGLYLVFAGAVYRHTEHTVSWRLRPLPVVETTRGWLPSVIMPAVQIVAIPAFGVAAYRAPGSHGTLFLVSVGVLAATLAARTLLTVVDNGHLFSRAVTDPLTGLFNHRHFHERLGLEVAAAERYGEELSVIILDLDDFSRVNSVGGHAVGDRVLVEAARCVERAVRDRDTVCRIGGDEIGVVLPEASESAALAIGSRIIREFLSLEGPGGGTVTVSIGVATFPTRASDHEELVRRADGAQYWAKYHGKNQVVAYDPAVVLTLDPEDRIRSLQNRAHLNSVRGLAGAVDARDGATQHHSRNVAALAVRMGCEVGLDENKLVLIELAGLLHDVGKIGLPDAVLRKRGALTAAERIAVQEHPVLGEHILASTRLTEILPWVRHHHERWDGSGYPDGLAAEDIPLEARILALCDAFDAMTSERPYRGALSQSAALQEIDLNLGTQFDPALGEAFIRVAGRRRAS